MQYCDNCGDELSVFNSDNYYISELITNIDSANKGESAVLCKKCYYNIYMTTGNESLIKYLEKSTAKEKQNKVLRTIFKDKPCIIASPNKTQQLVNKQVASYDKSHSEIDDTDYLCLLM